MGLKQKIREKARSFDEVKQIMAEMGIEIKWVSQGNVLGLLDEHFLKLQKLLDEGKKCFDTANEYGCFSKWLEKLEKELKPQ